MSDQQTGATDASAAFEALIAGGPAASTGGAFTTAFRGYDKDEVDASLAGLKSRLAAHADEIAFLEERHRRSTDAATAQNRQSAQRIAELEAELAAVTARIEETEQRLQAATDADADEQDAVARLEAELAAANARAASAEHRVEVLTDELVESTAESGKRPQFEEILRVAEDQASLVIRNATVQADRLLEAAREENANRRKEVQAEAEMIRAQAEHDAQQVRLRIETELTAHEAQIAREAAHAAEKVAQAEQEAAAIRTEAEKGAAALRSMVARETTDARAQAEEAVRELRVRALEFEESLTRRQDDAQQEFLVLHNQAVAHAERITQDANDQVAASLDHAQRVAAKADDFDRLMRAQAAQIEADANVRAREQLERARAKSQKILETVTKHSETVLRDAEDRTRQLRWQQHQLTSFMAEVKDLMRPETPFDAAVAEPAEPVETVDDAELAEAGIEPAEQAEVEVEVETEDEEAA